MTAVERAATNPPDITRQGLFDSAKREQKYKMNILYISVHAILEYDEISMLRSMGHFVFPLGSYFGGTPSQPFRPGIDFGPDLEAWMGEFQALGGVYSPNFAREQYKLPPAFIDMFDCCIIMHNPELFELFWETLSRIPVIWRTIGVDTENVERKMLPFREQGCKIVRYCPTEARANDYIGHDAVIRFAKSEREFKPYQRATNDILIFSNQFRERYKEESAFCLETMANFSFRLGGSGNEDLPQSIGVVSYEEQLNLLSSAAAYYYCAGSFIPYTLNFMEAWLAGVPVVALNCHAIYGPERCKFAEIPDLITSDVDGFLVSSVAQARELFTELITNPALAVRVGRAGHEKARSLFGVESIAPRWQQLLESL